MKYAYTAPTGQKVIVDMDVPVLKGDPVSFPPIPGARLPIEGAYEVTGVFHLDSFVPLITLEKTVKDAKAAYLD